MFIKFFLLNTFKKLIIFINFVWITYLWGIILAKQAIWDLIWQGKTWQQILFVKEDKS